MINWLPGILLLLPLCLPAQTTISGQVLDAKGKVVPAAHVYLSKSLDGSASDENGNYWFEVDSEIHDTLVVSSLGYATHQEVLILNTPGAVTINITLKKQDGILRDLVITAGAFEASDSKKATILKPLDVVTNPAARGDLYMALQTLPGTNLVGDQTGIFVRGGEAYETKTIIDGSIVDQPYFGDVPNVPSRGRFSPFLFKRTVFTTGGYSAEYGQALSSVLLLESYDLPTQTQSNLGLNFAGLDFGHTQVWNKNVSLAASLGYSNLRPYFELIPRNVEWETPPRSIGATTFLKAKLGKSGLFKSHFQYQHEDKALYLEDFSNDKTLFKNENSNLFANHSFETYWKKWYLFTSLGASINNNEDIFAGNIQRERNRLIQNRTTIGHDIHKNVYLKFGSEFNSRFHQVNDPEKVSFNNYLQAIYAESEVKAGSRWGFRLGTRSEYTSLNKEINLSPRISAVYKTGNESQLSASFGTFYQVPRERFLRNVPNLDFEKAAHYIINYQWTNDNYVFRAEIYRKQYQQLVSFTEEGVFNNQGSGFSQGIDLFWRDKVTLRNMDYWISYSFIDTKRRYLDFPEKVTPSFITKHKLNIIGQYRFMYNRARIGLSYTFTSGRPFDDPNLEGFLESHTKAYHNLNVSTSYLFSLKGNFSVFYISFSNPLGIDQVFGYEFSEDGSQRQAIIPSARRSVFAGISLSINHED